MGYSWVIHGLVEGQIMGINIKLNLTGNKKEMGRNKRKRLVFGRNC